MQNKNVILCTPRVNVSSNFVKMFYSQNFTEISGCYIYTEEHC